MSEPFDRDAEAEATPDERARAEQFARALESGLTDARGAEDEALAVARLLDGLREPHADEVSQARLRRALAARAAVRARARRAAFASIGALAAGLLVALGLMVTRRPSLDAAALDAKERAARAALARLAEARGSSSTGAALAASVATSRFESIYSTLEDARSDQLRWSGSTSGSSADAGPTPAAGGVS